MSFRVAWAGGATRDLKRLDKVVVRRILAAVQRLGETEAGSLKSLVDAPHGGTHRLRVGDWRAILRIEGDSVTVLRVLHRGEAYR